MGRGKEGGSGMLRAGIFLVVALVAGGAAMVVLYQLISSYQERIEEAQKPEDTVMAIVAARDLYQGVTVTEEDLFGVEIPPKYLPDGVFLSPEFVVGRIPRERILANEFVRNERLADPESGIGLNAVIPRGMRAISINIDQARGLSGFLNPGNYIDLLVTRMMSGDGSRKAKKTMGAKEDPKRRVTKTTLQAVFVLGVDSRMGAETRDEAMGRRGRHSPSVTLLVTAEQAEEVANSEQTGMVTLVLRNDLDVNYAATTGVDVDALLGKIKKPEVKRRKLPSRPKAKPVPTIKIIMGDQIIRKRVPGKR